MGSVHCTVCATKLAADKCHTTDFNNFAPSEESNNDPATAVSFTYLKDFYESAIVKNFNCGLDHFDPACACKIMLIPPSVHWLS